MQHKLLVAKEVKYFNLEHIIADPDARGWDLRKDTNLQSRGTHDRRHRRNMIGSHYKFHSIKTTTLSVV